MESNEREIRPPGFWNPVSARFRLTFLTCCVVLANSLVRNTLSMAMVCMVNSSNSSQSQSDRNEISSGQSHLLQGYGAGGMNWSTEEQGLLFSAIYFGGLLTGIPAGIYADRYNPKMVISLCLVLNMVGCLLTPLTAVNGGFIGLFILRFIIGLGGQATIVPCISAITSKWIPPNERSTVVAFYTSGSQIASIIGMPLNAFLCSKSSLGGWSSIFYANGILVLPVFILWLWDGSSSPDHCDSITRIEKRFIQESLTGHNTEVRVQRIPYKRIFTSMAVIVTLISNFALFTLNTILVSYMPTYLKEVHNVDLKMNGIYSSLPFLSRGIAKFLIAAIADCLISRAIFGRTCLCKTFNSVGAFGTAAFMAAIAYVSFSGELGTIVAVVFLTLANTMITFQVPGFLTSLTCIAPAYSGTVNALSRYCAQISSAISPLLVGMIVVTGTQEQWRIVYLGITCILTISGVLFLLFGSAEIQEWAKPEYIHDAEPLVNDDSSQLRI